MPDTLTPEQRSERMSRVRGKNTGPELAVRRIVHALGYRYRLHGAKLPGRPDLVFAIQARRLPRRPAKFATFGPEEI
jgi:DNA mismatch endonuclease, patch repair protein